LRELSQKRSHSLEIEERRIGWEKASCSENEHYAFRIKSAGRKSNPRRRGLALTTGAIHSKVTRLLFVLL
jgi:hypothetical protein